MDQKLTSLFSQVPVKPDYNPVRKAIDASKDQPETVAALKLFVSMPPSTGVLANPVRHRHNVPAQNATLELDIRSFTVRGKLYEEDIVAGRADAVRVIFVGLFGRLPEEGEVGPFRQFIAQSFALGLEHSLDKTREFMKTLPGAPPDVVIQQCVIVRK